MSRDDLFASNAGVVRDIAEAAAKACPKAFLAIITNPVNSTVPIASEVYKNNGVYDPKRIFGVTSLDIVRAQAFIAELKVRNFASLFFHPTIENSQLKIGIYFWIIQELYL